MKTLFATFAILISFNALAITGFLRSQDVSGSQRYCHYSNGVTITIPSTSLCPMSVD